MSNWQSEYVATIRRGAGTDYEEKGQVNLHDLASSMTPEQFAYLFDAYMNGQGCSKGTEVGRLMAQTHPSLQAYAIHFMIDFLRSIGQNARYTDARNDWAINKARKAAEAAE